MNVSELKKVFEQKGISEFEVYHVAEKSTEISTFNMQVDTENIAEKNEYYIRGVYNGKIASVYVEKETESAEEIADMIIRNAKAIESDDPYVIFGGSEKYATLPESQSDFDKYTLADFTKLCTETEQDFRKKMAEITTTECSLEISTQTVTITNSNGLDVSRTGTMGAFYISVAVTRNGEVRPSYAFQFFRKVSDIDKDRLFAGSAQRAYDSVGGKSVPSKSYPVVLENYAACSLLRAFAPMFSAENVIKKLSPLGDKLGQKVFGDNITLTDDPFAEKSVEKYTFDDEGVATFPKTVVEKGVLKTFLHSLKTAKMMGVQPTGNGFRFGNGMPANLCLETSGVGFDQMIKDIDDGLLITSLQGLHAGVSVTSGQFSLQSSGFRIEKGKITSPVTLIIASGNIFQLLNDVKCVSDDVVALGHICTGSIFVESLSISGN